jgi:hypothetical protein
VRTDPAYQAWLNEVCAETPWRQVEALRNLIREYGDEFVITALENWERQHGYGETA